MNKCRGFSKKFISNFLNNPNSRRGFFTDVFLMFLILFAALVYILESYEFNYEVLAFFKLFDFVISILFTIEVFLRFWIAKSKKAYFKSMYNIIDLFAILPFWFGFNNLTFLRIFRIFKFFRYSKRYLSFTKKFIRGFDLEKIFIMRIIFTLFTVIYVSSAIIYAFEKDLNPLINTFGDALYFTLITVTTVGFGDIIPVTVFGKVITMAVIVSGIIIIPWHISTLIKFLVFHKNKKLIVCNSCGFKHHERDAVFCKMCGNRLDNAIGERFDY